MVTQAQAEFVAWFDDIEKRFLSVPIHRYEFGSYPDEQAARAVIAEATTALASVFPERHALRVSWDELLKQAKPGLTERWLPGLSGTFHGAARLVREGWDSYADLL